jgi:phage tail-like protein
MALLGPVPVFNFYVALYDAPRPGVVGALATAAQAAAGAVLLGFSEVSGLNAESEIEEYREGGRNTGPHKFVKWGKHPNLVLKRGVSFSPALWDWHYASLYGGGDPPRKNGVIVLADRGGLAAGAPGIPVPLPLVDRTPVAAWSFTNGLPEKLQGSGLNAKANEIAIETLEIAHEGLIRLSAAQIPGAGAAVSAALGKVGL